MCEPLNILTLAAAMHFYPDEAVQLYRVAGSATAVMDNRRNLRDVLVITDSTVAERVKLLDAARDSLRIGVDD